MLNAGFDALKFTLAAACPKKYRVRLKNVLDQRFIQKLESTQTQAMVADLLREEQMLIYFQDSTSKLALKAYASGRTDIEKVFQVKPIVGFISSGPYQLQIVSLVRQKKDLCKMNQIFLKSKSEIHHRQLDRYIHAVNQVLGRPFYVSHLHFALVLAISHSKHLDSIFQTFLEFKYQEKFLLTPFLFPKSNENYEFQDLELKGKCTYDEFEEHYKKTGQALMQKYIESAPNDIGLIR